MLFNFAGVAVGAGWQLSVALINVGCYYLFGLPFGALLGYKFKQGVKGIWLGMLAGCLLQTIILILYVLRANWSREVSIMQIPLEFILFDLVG